MHLLRYVYVLALVIWLGGMAIAGMVVAPVAFSVLEGWDPSTGRLLAGRVFGAVLQRMSLITYIAGALMILTLTVQRLLGPRPRAYGIRVGLVAVIVALTMYSDLVATSRIAELQAQVDGPMNALPADDPRRMEFDGLHGLSTGLIMASLGGGLVLLGWETRE